MTNKSLNRVSAGDERGKTPMTEEQPIEKLGQVRERSAFQEWQKEKERADYSYTKPKLFNGANYWSGLQMSYLPNYKSIDVVVYLGGRFKEETQIFNCRPEDYEGGIAYTYKRVPLPLPAELTYRLLLADVKVFLQVPGDFTLYLGYIHNIRVCRCANEEQFRYIFRVQEKKSNVHGSYNFFVYNYRSGAYPVPSPVSPLFSSWLSEIPNIIPNQTLLGLPATWAHYRLIPELERLRGEILVRDSQISTYLKERVGLITKIACLTLTKQLSEHHPTEVTGGNRYGRTYERRNCKSRQI